MTTSTASGRHPGTRNAGPGQSTTTDPSRRVAASVTELGKVFTGRKREVKALDGVDLQIVQGEYVVVLGPSGCGKTTLLRCISGLETPTEGQISLQERVVFDARGRVSVKPNHRNVGLVFQNYALWPHMSVERNVGYPLRMRRTPRPDRASRVAEVLEALECTVLAKRLPAELSGGQQQRVALARALVSEPAILLLDEPLSNLDALLRVTLRAELLRLHRKLGFTAIHITHDQEEALEMGDRVVLMRQGRIEQMGPPAEVYARPVSPYAANFLGVRNRLDMTVGHNALVVDGAPVVNSGAIADHLSAGTEVRFFARDQDVQIRRPQVDDAAKEELALDGVLAQIVLGPGGRPRYIVDVHKHQWYAAQAASDDLRPGDAVKVVVDRSRALLYRDDRLVSN